MKRMALRRCSPSINGEVKVRDSSLFPSIKGDHKVHGPPLLSSNYGLNANLMYMAFFCYR